MPLSPSDNGNPPAAPARGRRPAAVAALVLAAAALALYRPWVDRPFDTLDFSEFLPLLTGPGTFGGRLAALTHYYVGEHARFNVLSYAGIAAKWTLLGASPILWQWARVAEMGLLVAGVYLLFRRLALRPLPAMAGASLFVFSRIVGEAWTRMTMGEPLGLLCALGALLLATTWRTGSRPVLRAAGAGLLVAGAVLAKEMLIGVLPLVWLVGIARGPDGRLSRPVRSGDTLRWLGWSTLAPLVAFGIALVVALQGGGSAGFTGMYGEAPAGVGIFVSLAVRPWMVVGGRPGLDALAMPGNLCFLLLIVIGGGLAFSRAEWRHHFGWTAVGALILSLAYAVLYLPWPYAYLYYGIPFLLGPALLFGLSLQLIADERPRGPVAALIGWVAVLVTTAPATGQAASLTIALQQVNGDLVHTIAQVPHAERLVVARVSPAPRPWMGSAAMLRRYAIALGTIRALPAAEDLGCRESAVLLERPLGGTIFVTYPGACGGIQSPSVHIARGYRVLDLSWSGVTIRSDSVIADVLIGLDAMRPEAPGGDSTHTSPAGP